MSKSPSNFRSPTPTPADPFPSTNQETTPQGTQPSAARNESFTLHPILPAAALEIEPYPRGQSRPIRLIESNSSDSHMAKRLRISEDASQSDGQLGPSQQSQDCVASSSASSTTDAQDEQSTTSQNPPLKKKRTRTLTTPHQSMVLHQLLAQSRFPTTAMREEVGRSIGLSARKVQIWFQNQRQKLRRPRSQSEANINGPQYGAFPSVPPPPGTHAPFSAHLEENSFQLGQPCSSSSQALLGTSTSVSTPEPYSSLSETPSLLLGPGVPGLELHPRAGPLTGSNSSSVSLPQIGQFDTNYSAAGASRLMHQSPSPASPARGRSLPRPLSFPSHFSDAYRTLPPVVPSSQTGPGLSQPRAPAQPSAGQLYFVDTAQPMAIDRPFIHYRPVSPRVSGTPGISAGGCAAPSSIPPPFTLQPSPQWDDRSFTSLLVRPNIWSPPSSSRGSASPTQSFSAPSTLPPLSSSVSISNQRRVAAEEIHPVGEQTRRNAQPSLSQTPPPQLRIGRYDPVRAAIIPFSNPSPPSQSAALPSSDTDRMEDSN